MIKSEGANEHGVDIISSLPDHILELILSGIPITQVVLTSILSRRWRYLWKSIPSFASLNIDPVHSQRFVHWALAKETPLDLLTKFGAFTMKAIIRILKCFPNLESLYLIIQEGLLWPTYWNLDEVERWRILARHMKRVEFLEFNGEKPKVDVARVLLEHGNALEDMVFSWRDKVKYHEKSTETMNIVSKFHKASSTAKLTPLLKV